MEQRKPDLQWLSDPAIFAVNRLQAHSDHYNKRSKTQR